VLVFEIICDCSSGTDYERARQPTVVAHLLLLVDADILRRVVDIEISRWRHGRRILFRN
jgi:hypothetical protein